MRVGVRMHGASGPGPIPRLRARRVRDLEGSATVRDVYSTDGIGTPDPNPRN